MKAFTAEHILEVDFAQDGDRIEIIYTVGRTNSDSGYVNVYLDSCGFADEPNRYDVQVMIDGDINWGIAACASALLVVTQDFPIRFPQYEITDNTGIKL